MPEQTEIQLTANLSSVGGLSISAVSFTGNKPIADATIEVAYTNAPDVIVEILKTDSEGRAGTVELKAPNIEYSLTPGSPQPYATLNLRITRYGYETTEIRGVQLLPEVTAKQNFVLTPVPEAPGEQNTEMLFYIGPNVLNGNYPPSIIEDEIKPLNETGEVVLDEVVIPEYIIVHDGTPRSDAPNYWVRYKDYIKNVASSEIYATWPTAAIYANVLAIQSFTLNRVYTEWYRNKGYDFTITSSTAYDHKWIPERNIFDTIDKCVDDIFTNYLSRPGVKQPILTQYCDGVRVTCPNLMSQWGSKDLADQGYTASEILKYFYGDTIYINTSELVSGVPSSYPGYVLGLGSNGSEVRTIQQQLNVISTAYPRIPKVTVDGIYGRATAESVRTFQDIFDLPTTGVVDFSTWYKISQLYVGVSQIAEYQ
ncbi:MAG: peptidoglycan-binding protein [Lachnospiraceae bacterium]